MSREKKAVVTVDVNVFSDPIRGKISDTDSWLVILSNMFASSFILVCAISSVYFSMLKNEWYWYMLSFFLVIIGVWLLAHAIRNMFHYKELMIDDDMVRVESRGWTGADSFIEPWINYSGIMSKTVRYMHKGLIKTKYEIVLYHGDKTKHIPLYRAWLELETGEDDIEFRKTVQKRCSEISNELGVDVLDSD